MKKEYIFLIEGPNPYLNRAFANLVHKKVISYKGYEKTENYSEYIQSHKGSDKLKTHTELVNDFLKYNRPLVISDFFMREKTTKDNSVYHILNENAFYDVYNIITFNIIPEDYRAYIKGRRYMKGEKLLTETEFNDIIDNYYMNDEYFDAGFEVNMDINDIMNDPNISDKEKEEFKEVFDVDNDLKHYNSLVLFISDGTKRNMLAEFNGIWQEAMICSNFDAHIPKMALSLTTIDEIYKAKTR